jgi:hypothetical protein
MLLIRGVVPVKPSLLRECDAYNQNQLTHRAVKIPCQIYLLNQGYM